jgi:hypothetical protein
MVLQNKALVEVVLLNQNAADETMVMLAQKLGERELEILAGNQMRILRFPAIIEAIYFNKQARMSTVKRLLELAVRNGLTLEGIPEFKEIAAQIEGQTTPVSTPSDEVIDMAFAAALADGEDEVGGLEIEDEDGSRRVMNLLEMPLIDKLRMATIGSPGKRAILIKDSNKIVSMAVIKSPGISDQEAARYVADRAIHEDVIRYIANRKEWQKNYILKLNLVKNPKCPLAQSMRLIKHLRPADIRGLARSKNIPAALAKVAKQMLNTRR